MWQCGYCYEYQRCGETCRFCGCEMLEARTEEDWRNNGNTAIRRKKMEEKRICGVITRNYYL
jgi:hypothetical protein